MATVTETRTALVTGAGSGIGRAFAVELSTCVHQLHLLDIDERSLARLATDLGVTSVIQGDVADPAAMERVATTTGAVDLLCLNAGIVSASTGAPWDATPAEWDRVIATNLLGVVNGLRSFVPLMLERGSPSKIIITASLAGVTTWPGGGPYAASKHAVLAVAEQAALKLANTNIDVTVLCPALVKTSMSEVGEDPKNVVIDALRAADERRFAVVPAAWQDSVEKRAADLARGLPPTLPRPNA